MFAVQPDEPEHVPPTKQEKIALALTLVRGLGQQGNDLDEQLEGYGLDERHEIATYMQEILEVAPLPPKLVQETWLCPSMCGTRVKYGTSCPACAEKQDVVKSGSKGLGISEIANADVGENKHDGK
jgi:hypothetical protein